MLYELVMQGRLFSQQWVMRWNYLSTGTGASVRGSFGLMYAFGAIPELGVFNPDAPFVKITNLMATECVVDTMTARAASLYAPEDFYERPFPTPYVGQSGSAGTSPTLAYGFRTNRVSLAIARGTKRVPGMTEAAMDAGGNIGSTALAVMVDAAEAMSEILSYDDEGSPFSYTPCVVQKLEYTTTSGKKAYKYYPTLETQLEHVAAGVTWQPYTTARTQTSRQYGRGS